MIFQCLSETFFCVVQNLCKILLSCYLVRKGGEIRLLFS
ncbi:hypothetical protein GBL_3599 [Geobacillus kaustophilus GBlys]|uniref:Uncharacterized protein n=1 Tax=Geobacillus kaustophilus GBlys TaxID=1337888 RepID=U2X983_GEOKU|nr:hypothetical protein GBL_3599 [Geobacillus kaustophilus GBlys]